MTPPDTPSKELQPDTSALLADAHQQSQLAAQILERALQKPWHEVMLDSDEAERLAIQMRDRLIARIHQGNLNSGENQALRSVLDQLNMSLSLIVGIAYPSNGIRRPVIEQARDVLKAI
jgi:hypothetical protein